MTWTTADDAIVPAAHAERFVEACRRGDVPVAFTLYPHGPHAMGLALDHPATWAHGPRKRAHGSLSAEGRGSLAARHSLSEARCWKRVARLIPPRKALTQWRCEASEVTITENLFPELARVSGRVDERTRSADLGSMLHVELRIAAAPVRPGVIVAFYRMAVRKGGNVVTFCGPQRLAAEQNNCGGAYKGRLSRGARPSEAAMRRNGGSVMSMATQSEISTATGGVIAATGTPASRRAPR
jgi:hypothetical protein